MSTTSTNLPAQSANQSLIARARTALTRADGMMAQPALRRALPAIGLMAVVVLGLAAWLLLVPADRVALQSGLPPSEKARALDTLTAQGIDAQLDTSSGMLTVTADQFHRARMVLATEGLPQGPADGMTAISQMPMGTSRLVESARLRRMHELDLARSITELKPIRAARVHLALPERSAFVRDTQPPRASVFVELAPGMALSEAQVRAIVSLVSTGVSDMPQANVSVVDQTGALLTPQETDPVQAEADRQMQHQRRLEQVYRDRVLALLTPMLGIGNAAVEVTLDMDFTRSEITSEEYMPDTALRSEQSSRQETTNRRAAGVPGAVSNTPPPEATLETERAEQSQDKAATNSSISSTRNYEVSRRVETRQPQVAQIKRVHAAILIQKPAAPAPEQTAEGGEAPPTLQLDEIEALAKSAIGFDQDRGDQVTVTSAPFVAMASVMPQANWYDAAWLPVLGRTAVQLALLGIIVLGVVRPILQRLLPPLGATGGQGMTLGDAVEVPKGETMMALRKRLETPAPDADDLDGAITYEEKIELLRQMAGSETNRITGVFKNMLTPAEENQS